MDHDCGSVVGSQERFTFAQLPLAMRKDPTLKHSDVIVAMFILPWMRGHHYGWTTVELIATGAGVSERSVQYSLRRLNKAGWFGIEPSKINPSRREFTARWLTDDGFEVLVKRLGIDGYSEQIPQLIYSPDLARVPEFAPYEYAPSESRIFQLPISLADQSMIDSEQSYETRSPKIETALNATAFAPPATEDARNAAAIERGVRGMYRSRIPRKVVGGTVGCVARLVAKRLDDEHSHPCHCGVLWRVVDGELPPGVYLGALNTALTETHTREGEVILSKGARFLAMIAAMEVRRTDGEFDEEWIDQRTPLTGVAS